MFKFEGADKLPKIKKKERKGLIETMEQINGDKKTKSFGDMDDNELKKFETDLKDTEKYLLDNKASYGDNYDFAKSFLDKIKDTWLKEIKKRNI